MNNKKIFKLIFLLSCFFSTVTYSLSETDRAILIKGPIYQEGVEYLEPSAMPVLYGEYLCKEQNIFIYYIEKEITPLKVWEKQICRDIELFKVINNGRDVYFYYSNKGWSFFVSFPVDFTDKCGFVTEFLRRLNYFIGISRENSDFSFPAILDFE